MSNMTSESKDIMVSDDCIDAPSFDEASSGGGNVGSNMLKKGPWTSAEDAILVEYVKKHGEGNWNAVQKHSGLSRGGKSCRLRWANHLRPDLKKGAFTPEEERRIIELHAKMGNKWARMAAELPGRTDNEIKNFWNTRIKRRQRAGLPIYPPDICSQALDDNEQSHNMGTFSTGNNTPDPKSFSAFNFDIPAVEFECLEVNQTLYPPPTLLDITSKTVLSQALGSSCSNNSILFPPTPGYFDGSENILGFSSLYDDNNTGSHALLNGNFSTSGSASKIELPSLQYSSDTQVRGGSWWGLPASPLPSLESVDTLIQSPPPTDEPTQQQQPHDSLSPMNNGLLESILYESQSLKRSKKNPSNQRYSDGGSVAVSAGGDVVVGGGSTTQLRDAEWGEVYGGDPISPLGHSATSVFTEYTTPASGSSFEDPDSVETLPAKAKPAVEWDPTQCSSSSTNTYISNQTKKYSKRPELLLESNWFGPDTERGKDHSTLTGAIGQLLGEEEEEEEEEEDSFLTCRNFNHYSFAASSSSLFRQGGPGSCKWK